jgi:predicted dehydrogenase
MKCYNVAIIGFGNIGFFFSKDKKRKKTWSHFQAYTNNSQTKIVAIVEINFLKRQLIKKKFKKIYVFKNICELYNSNLKIDIISICTPTATHYEILKYSIKLNPALIICEKPLCSNISQSKKIIDIIKKNKINLVINHQLRFNKNIILARKIIEKNLIGEIKSINSYYTSKIFNIGIHLIDLIRFIINKNPVSTYAFFSKNHKIDPTISGTLFFKNNIICTINSIAEKFNYIYEIDILGLKGRLKLIDAGKKIELYKYLPSKNFTGYKELKKIKLSHEHFTDYKFYNDSMKILFREAVHSIKKKRPFLPDVYDGYNNLFIAHKMIVSAYKKKEIKL